MNLLTEAIGGLGAPLFPIAAGLLLEELTLGGLVRIVMAPWIRTERRQFPANSSSSGENPTHNNDSTGGKK